MPPARRCWQVYHLTPTDGMIVGVCTATPLVQGCVCGYWVAS